MADLKQATLSDMKYVAAAVYSEASAENGGNVDEMKAIAACIYNMAYWAKQHAPGRKCYNGSFGNGGILSAIKAAILGYGQPKWNALVTSDIPKADGDIHLSAGDEAVYKKCLTAANDAHSAKLPVEVSARALVQFNRAKNQPPSGRMEFVVRLGAHSFYAFKAGRELE